MKTNVILKHTIHFNGSFPYYIAPLGKYFRISGMCEFTGIEDKNVDPVRIKEIQDYFIRVFKLENPEFLDYWACQRPVTCDDLPIIGKFPKIENAFINAGHGSRGSIFSFASAEIITHIILKKSPITDPAPYSPNRFYI